MDEPLLGVEELAEIRGVGTRNMITPIMILRGEPITTTDAEYDPQYDYGDDASVEPDVAASQGIVAGADGKLKGWFVSTLQQETRVDTGELATVDVHVLRLPVGVDLRVRDTVRVIATEEEFNVVDTNGDDTWAEWLEASLRRAE